MMLDSERLQVYLQSLTKQETGRLQTIKQEAMEGQIPIIRDEMADLLMFLLRMKKPMRILEVGTAGGYSSLWMRRFLEPGAHITTMEMDVERAAKARENFRRMEAEADITFLEGDATKLLAELPTDGFDFIFMDAAKAQYLGWLPEMQRLLVKGGLLVTDNILFDGDVLQSRFAVTRRDRTIHDRLRDYLYALKNTEGLTTSIVNVGDGAALTVKE